MTLENEEGRPGGGGLPTDQPGGEVETTIRHPAAYGSLYAPAGRRTMWWFTFRCPHCGAGHFGRVRDRDAVPGVRRSGCGRLVWVIVARTYPGGGQ